MAEKSHHPDIPSRSNKMCDQTTGEFARLRVYHRKQHKKGRRTVSPRLLIKCGCCDSKVEIYYDEDPREQFAMLEINGVDGSVRDWRKVFLPLLRLKKQGGVFVEAGKKKS